MAHKYDPDKQAPLTSYFADHPDDPLKLICPVTGEDLLQRQHEANVISVYEVASERIVALYWLTKPRIEQHDIEQHDECEEYEARRRGNNHDRWVDLRVLCHPVGGPEWWGWLFRRTALSQITWEQCAWENMEYLLRATLQYILRNPTVDEVEWYGRRLPNLDLHCDNPRTDGYAIGPADV